MYVVWCYLYVVLWGIASMCCSMVLYVRDVVFYVCGVISSDVVLESGRKFRSLIGPGTQIFPSLYMCPVFLLKIMKSTLHFSC